MCWGVNGSVYHDICLLGIFVVVLNIVTIFVVDVRLVFTHIIVRLKYSWAETRFTEFCRAS